MSRRRAFTLPQVLVGIILSLVTLTMSVPIFHYCSIGLHRDQVAATSEAALDHSIDLLRRDIWQAQSVDLLDPQQLLINSSAGPIRWQFSSAGIARKPADAPAQRWTASAAIASAARLEKDGALIKLTLPAAQGHAAENFAFTCPGALFAEATR